jgi:hypothetical protein
MAGNATDYLEPLVLQHTLGIAAMPMPAVLYVGLCTTAPSDVTQGVEVAGGGYTRIAATFAMSSGYATNDTTLEWPAATAPWGNVGWAEIWDAPLAGNRLYWLPLVDPADMVTPVTKSVATGDIMRFPAGDLRISCD